MINEKLNILKGEKVLEVTIGELTRLSELVGGLHMIAVLFVENGTYHICMR